jgi:xeroderma pigmentosum group C-complementing protein
MGPDGEDAQTGLYSLFQTDLYIPEPVVDGKISKNAFGNLDVYVPSMVPPGAVHIRAPEAKNAARLLNIDYADAVTGFQFRGRHGTAIIDGIIVASEFRAAVDAVLDGIAHMKEEAMEASRSAECLRLWRRFLVGLRVVQRVRGYGREEGEEEDRVADEEFQKELEQEMAQYRDRSPEEDGGGGFLVGAEEEDMPIRAARSLRQRLPSEDQDDDGFDDDDYYDSGGSVTEVKDQDEEEIEDHSVVLPSLAREPSLFGLEKFDIPAAVRISEGEHDDYGSGGFMIDENVEDVHISRDIMAELGADQTLMQTGTPASPQRPKKKGSPTDEETAASDQARRNAQELTKENSNTAEQPHSLELALNATSSGISQGQFRAASNKSGAPQAEDVNETQPPQPAPAVSTAASSEFDDELPLEDPEDEDAEPEWLL